MSDWSQQPEGADPEREVRASRYWRANLRLLAILFAIWFAVSYGAGILFADALNRIVLFGFPVGFWFAQQGAIYVFVILIFVYVWAMKRLERRHGMGEEAEPADDRPGQGGSGAG